MDRLRLQKWVSVGAVLAGVLLAVGAAGYAAAWSRYFRPNVELTVDNATPAAVTVYLDGREAAVVPGWSVERVLCRAGVRRVEARRGEQVVFLGERDLRKPADPDRPTRYLLNVEGAGRYRKHEVEYGTSFRPSLRMGSLSHLLGDAKSRLRSQYRE